MAVRFFYVDESYDDTKFCLSAISIRHSDWKQCFDAVKAHRQRLKADHGIFVRKEIHARDLVSGRGRISPEGKPVGKWMRSRIFYSLLQLVARLPGVLVFNICLDKVGCRDPHLKAWDRLINRIERTMLEFDNRELHARAKIIASVRDHLPGKELEFLESRLNIYRSRAFIVSDEGRENEIIKALRKMGVINYIPSQFGQWPSGAETRNIVTERIIEDPFFKASHRSNFLQLADCVAFALLKREVPPTPNIEKYGINKMFEEVIGNLCYKKASPRDPYGIVRG
ncbi:MAG: DUF3800 domain-containing protein [Isosphaeraceae bacterium]